MRLSSHIFSFLKKEQKDEDEDTKKRKEKCRNHVGKVIASTALMLMLLTSIYAEPVSAGLFDSVKKKASNLLDRAKNGFKTGVAYATTGFVIGLMTPIPGVDEAVLAAGGFIIGFIKGAMEEPTDSKNQVPLNSGRYATKNETDSDSDNPNIVKVVDNINQKAYGAIAELTAKLRSDLVEYDINEEGATGDLWAKIYAPQTIYGFSAFPVQVKIYTKEGNIPFSKVHIRSIKIYLLPENSSVPLWTRTWDYGSDGSQGLNGESVVYSTVLKVPDDYVYKIEQAIQTGQVTRQLINELWNATTKTWEIYVDINAYRELWQNDPTKTTQSDCEAAGGKWDSSTNTCYVFVRNADINYRVHTTSAWRHVSMARDIAMLADGMYASLPIKFLKSLEANKWAIYQEEFTGALSNFIILSAASPIHVIDSTADYKFYIAPNPKYFEPLNVTFKDDFRFVVVREYKDLSWTIAYSIFGKLGTLTDDSPGIPKLLTAKYTGGPDVLTYKVYGLAMFTITRDDGIPIKIWLVVEPKVSVIPNTRTVLDDSQVEQLTQFTEDGKLTDEEIKQTRAMAQSWISGLQEKITNAESIQKKAAAEGNKKAELYAKKAIEAYKDAIDALNKVMQTDDTRMFLNWLNVAKKLEQAGDFYNSAAEKALFGEYKQAELDAKAAGDLVNLANEYKPRLDLSLSGLLNGKLPFGLTTMDLIVLAIGIIAIIIGKQLGIGPWIGILILLFWFGGMLVEKGIDTLLDRLL